MQLLILLRVLRALSLLIREIWLRERTFRQFVHENLALLIAVTGLIVMSGLFANVFTIARNQDLLLVGYKAREEEMGQRIDSLSSDLAWYRSMAVRRGLETIPEPVIEPIPKPPPSTPKLPAPPDPAIVQRAPNTDLSDRWKRLTQ